jgi:hypothetical protein
MRPFVSAIPACLTSRNGAHDRKASARDARGGLLHIGRAVS